MKSIIKLVVFSLVAITTFTACDKDDVKPIKEVKNTFKDMYPDAKRAEWEMEHGYYVVDFHQNGYEKEAWFETNGTWVLTETDYERNAPAIIKDAIKSTEYSDWRIDDVDYVEMRELNPFYVVEVEKGEREMDLFFSETGELLRSELGNGDYRPIP